ncbi:hypothetical protein [Burkholderia cenocepacia]|uniref:hypothetical protein n=1 Tax=Burkholderia cenocepacia TaxID=95486 RepID=UPI0021AB4707|nr:hypothetical protein [Burkholderia cenocepacia]
MKNGVDMKREIAASAATTAPAVVSDVWLWLQNHDAAWWVSILTVIWILSQLYWGWAKFFRGSGNEQLR